MSVDTTFVGRGQRLYLWYVRVIHPSSILCSTFPVTGSVFIYVVIICSTVFKSSIVMYVSLCDLFSTDISLLSYSGCLWFYGS